MGQAAGSRDEYGTPDWILNPSRRALGGVFDLDPASNPAAQYRVGAGQFWTREQDGLRRGKWYAGSVWLNPPYSAAGPWCETMRACWRDGDVDKGIVLITATAAFGTRYGLRLVRAARLLVLPGRVAFIRPDGTEAPQPRDGSVLVCGGGCLDVGLARRVLEEIGLVIEPAFIGGKLWTGRHAA